MQSLILTLHIIVCILLVILILLQSGKEGMGVIFGGGNSSVFGSTGAGGILAKLTALMAIIFIITSLSYTYVSSSRNTTDSVILDVQIDKPAPQSSDTQPVPKPEVKESAPPADAPPAMSDQAPAPEAKKSVSPADDSPAQTEPSAPMEQKD